MFQLLTKLKNDTSAMSGLDIGKAIRKNVLKWPHPSMRALSITLRGIEVVK